MNRDPQSTARPRPPLARLALRVPSAGSSGLIDVTSLRAEPIPLSLAPPGPPPLAEPSTPRWGLAAITAALGAGLSMVALAAVFQPQATIVVQDSPTVDRQMSMAEVVEPVEHTTDEHPTDEPAASEAAIDGAPAPVVTPAKSSSKATSKSKSKARTKSSSKRTSKSKSKSKSSKTKTSGNDAIAVECVLDPSRCDASGKPSSSTATSGTGKALPAKLSTTQLKQGLAKAKASARSCGPQHGVDPGTRVQVKLSIRGATGTVSTATPQAAHAQSSLGRCVATALGQATFPRFSTPQMGMMYTVRL